MKFFLVVAAMIGNPIQAFSVVTYWPLYILHAPGVDKYLPSMCDSTFDFAMVTIPTVILALVAKKALLKCSSLVRVNVRTA